LTLSTHFITALGHAENVPLLQKIPDKHFITPTALVNTLMTFTITQKQSYKIQKPN
jgi:hypothetical protein